MASCSWHEWAQPPTSEENTAVTGRDFTVVDLPTDKNDERKYGAGSLEPTERRGRKDLRANPYIPERFPFYARPREVPCLQCTNRMMVNGFHGLCRDQGSYKNGKCYCCVQNGDECEEVPETAFKSAYELQVSARKMDEGHEDTDWEYLSGRAELALMKEGLLWFARADTNDYWDGNNHVKEVTNGKANHVGNDKYYWNDGTTNWHANDHDHVKKAVNHKVNWADKGEPYSDDDNTSWGDKDTARWNDNGDVNVNANANQVDNDNTNLSDNGVPRWGDNQESAWDDQDDTNWAGGKGDGWGAESAPDSEVDNDCDDESNHGSDIQYTPESSTDQIVSAIDRNTDVVAELCEIMDGIKWGLDRLHEDNVQNKKVLEKLLNEQRPAGNNLGTIW